MEGNWGQGKRLSPIGAHVPPEIKEAVQAWCRSQGISESEYILNLIQKDLDSKLSWFSVLKEVRDALGTERTDCSDFKQDELAPDWR